MNEEKKHGPRKKKLQRMFCSYEVNIEGWAGLPTKKKNHDLKNNSLPFLNIQKFTNTRDGPLIRLQASVQNIC